MLQSMAVPDKDPTNLHDLAVDAQTDIQKLATGLAHAGAAPAAVAQLTKMSDILSQVVKALAEGPPLGQGAPGAEQPPPGPAAPQQPPAPPAAPPEAPHAPTLHAAAQGLHQAMIASAQQRVQPPR